MSSTARESLNAVMGQLEKFAMRPLDGAKLPGELTVAQRRRSGPRRREEPVSVVALTEADGVLRWRVGTPVAPARRFRATRRAGLGKPADGEVVGEFKIEDTPPNAIGRKLRELDEMLTPGQGLRMVTPGGELGGKADPVSGSDQRILLLVHGTFSNVDTLLEELRASAEGRALLGRMLGAGSPYSQVLGFNHPTLSVSPILNAVTLGQHFRNSQARVDVICHSRGGLVTRWWRELVDQSVRPTGHSIFVGSPLMGTGLAAPARLKHALDMLTNLANALTTAAKVGGAVFPMAGPLWTASTLLFGFFGKATTLAAKTPVLDAGVALIPGLAAQSMEGANGEVLGARESFRTRSSAERRRLADTYSFVTSNFESENPGWKFWRNFRKDRILDVTTDVIFEGDNDLVVDTPSMTSLADVQPKIRDAQLKRFGENDHVTHVSYFQEPATIEFLDGRLRAALPL